MKDKFREAYFLLFPILLLVIQPFDAQASMQKADTLNVGVAGDEPFVVNRARQTGISLEVWQAVANMKGLNYKLNSYSNVPKALTAMEQGKVGLVVGPVSIYPERAKQAKFTQPYYQSSISIMSQKVSPGFFQRIGRLFSFQFLYGVLGFLFILAIVGFLFWLAEHKVNPDEFSAHPIRGIGDGMWCAIVTMTTTGYGDIAPRTLSGRIVAGSWMIICIVFATTMVAGIASSLSMAASETKTITKAEQLANHKVGVVENSPADAFVDRYGGVNEIYIDNLKEGYKYLKAEKVNALVYDRPQMVYFLQNHHDEDVAISKNQYMREGYGFAVPLDSKLLHEIDITLLRLQESGKVDRIVTQWLGENN